MKSSLLAAALAFVFGFLGAATWSYSGLGDARTRAYLLDNPELLPQMADAYQRTEAEKRLAGVRGDVMKPFPGAILGNPNGSKILVEFTDYNCPYCKASMGDLTQLVESDPDLKVVVREWPIFQGSDLAARMALAAAKQGKYAEFHDAMFRLTPATPESINQAAREVGLDMAQAQKDGASPEVEQELARNYSLAQQLGFTGTPSWVTEHSIFEGAIGLEGLRRSLEPVGE